MDKFYYCVNTCYEEKELPSNIKDDIDDTHCFACNPSDRVYIVSNERYKQLREDAKKGIGVLSEEDIASAIENTKKYMKGRSDNV